MTRWLYAVVMWLAQPLLRRKLRRRGAREPGYLSHMDERFGQYAQAAPPSDAAPLIWIHAVSLGETRAAAVLIKALRAEAPAMRLLLTHGTATGRAEGQGLLHPGDLQCWQPWDSTGPVGRFLRHFKPTIGVLMETEVWPNLVHACQQQGVPLLLANARLSDKSLQQALRLAWLARPAYQALTAVWAQTLADADRLAQLGAPVQGVLGNLKFDATPNAQQIALGRRWRAQSGRPVVMLAVSREGEEFALLQILKKFCLPAHAGKAKIDIESIVNGIQWLIVPRHPQRFDVVAEMILAQGFGISRRSTWGEVGPEPCSTEPLAGLATQIEVWLGDSLGEMALYYGLADVALLGGSYQPLGGQNLIEAAACTCPVVMGPHTFNFADAAEQAIQSGAGVRVTDLNLGVQTALTLAANTLELSSRRQACSQFAQAHRGAAKRLAQAIIGSIAQPETPS
ncbi:MAG: 3-deoxy-D-manno-octulosonic acid transferase [Rhodoferax sp.]|jgi:3-deoxy-D-manno-octulosonic-acid transferase|uniref:3-deoxy-D-manno-octulosonic acid transferase n=1 Tax=Rhodoferax sp. TaxID=50421 RepID=UPI001B45F714|nr:3-deoxy-D-manno-octulosonic acid transferase [Rhodoferax sp.]MBP8285407.1 3-deoxy-D-manno-octulosonic acid transferase [Rhodoferax sp.]MBP9736684.1 3-deoxy-D-manno-octulosonic acid transferase [Rhodoferax sp.]